MHLYCWFSDFGLSDCCYHHLCLQPRYVVSIAISIAMANRFHSTLVPWCLMHLDCWIPDFGHSDCCCC